MADAIELKRGETVLDIGCGWGRLVQHFSDKYGDRACGPAAESCAGAKVTGLTLSSEQKKFADELNKHNEGQVLLQDAMKMDERTDLPAQFDKITSLEMAEHVGIRRYNEFLTKAPALPGQPASGRQVHAMLKDDGVFYFQVAGLRRHWAWEDLVWGLFMGEHVFPGADASCPLGWVSTHLERAGFEIQRVNNLGTHYSRTLAQWLEEWHLARDSIVAKYGVRSYRRWEVFLAWSSRIARLGSSTVFMFTLTKAQTVRRVQTQKHIAPQLETVTAPSPPAAQPAEQPKPKADKKKPAKKAKAATKKEAE